MENLFLCLKEKLEAKEDAVIVSVVSSSGSAPRGAGAKMLVAAKGRVFGTIGGGAVEYESQKLAEGFLKEKKSGVQSFDLAPGRIGDLGMVCGGKVTIYFQYISCGDKSLAAFLTHAAEMEETGEACWLITDISRENGGAMSLFAKSTGFYGEELNGLLPFVSGVPSCHELNGREYLIERIADPGTLYIFGGGHVAQELVPVAHRAGFRCAVLDDRPEFAKKELFPDAVRVIEANLENVVNHIEIGEDDYVVIMTRGHKYDSSLQAQVMRTKAGYIGVMGSRAKKAHVAAKMRELGFSDEDLCRVKTPIGLDIGAETPAEIAVSITAELIMEKRGKISKISRINQILGQ